MRKRSAVFGVLAFASIFAFLILGTSWAAEGMESGQGACAKLTHLVIADTYIISAVLVPADQDLPEYCQVRGYVSPAINFEVRLPASNWNDKFYMAGCGGYCGQVLADRPGFTNAPNYGLRRNYAVACTDSGHWGSAVYDGTWAYYNRQGEIDWGYRSIHEVQRVARAVIKAYYGKNPDYAYFAGCSTGGRQAVMEAWKYPDDFDGIIAGAPALDYTGLVATFFSWVVQANRDPEGKTILDHSKLKLLIDAVYQECDAIDGLKDGIIDDPRKCTFDPESLLCHGSETEPCLTPEQVVALKKLYSGPKNSAGMQLYPGGLPYGSEPFWSLWVTGSGKNPGLIELFNINFLKYMAFETDPDSSYDHYKFNFDSDPPKLAFMGEIYNATNPDLSKFREKGGKLILYHGWADSIVTPLFTINYYESVIDKMGGLEQTQDFFRLFMVPGMDHCSILPGKGPDDFDVLTALENWVEKDVAPERIVASKLSADKEVIRTRPLCPYPRISKYKGTGSVDSADNFTCAE